MPVSPAPTNQIQAKDIEAVARLIAAPEAAKPRKAGSAKGKGEEGKKPKAAAAKIKEPTVKRPKRKTKANNR